VMGERVRILVNDEEANPSELSLRWSGKRQVRGAPQLVRP
jgi:hypothetical protein